MGDLQVKTRGIDPFLIALLKFTLHILISVMVMEKVRVKSAFFIFHHSTQSS